MSDPITMEKPIDPVAVLEAARQAPELAAATAAATAAACSYRRTHWGTADVDLLLGNLSTG